MTANPRRLQLDWSPQALADLEALSRRAPAEAAALVRHLEREASIVSSTLQVGEHGVSDPARLHPPAAEPEPLRGITFTSLLARGGCLIVHRLRDPSRPEAELLADREQFRRALDAGEYRPSGNHHEARRVVGLDPAGTIDLDALLPQLCSQVGLCLTPAEVERLRELRPGIEVAPLRNVDLATLFRELLESNGVSPWGEDANRLIAEPPPSIEALLEAIYESDGWPPPAPIWLDDYELAARAIAVDLTDAILASAGMNPNEQGSRLPARPGLLRQQARAVVTDHVMRPRRPPPPGRPPPRS